MASLYLRKNGVFYGAFSKGGKRIYRSTGCRDREQAKVVFDQLCAEYEPFKKMTISQFRLHLTHLLEGSVSAGTAAINEDALIAFERLVGNLTLRSVTAYHIESFKSARLKEVAPATVARDFRHLKAAFARAHKFKMIETNPFLDVHNVRVPEKAPQFLSQDQCEELLRRMPSEPMKAVVLFAASTGMRLGEIVNLRWLDVDLSKQMIRVSNRENFVTKNRRDRTLPMNDTVIAILESLPKRGEYVFVGYRGGRLNPGWVSRKFKSYIRSVGLSEELHFHSLRHYADDRTMPSRFTDFRILASSPLACSA